jgi:CzcA family heavy metal efflux pump
VSFAEGIQAHRRSILFVLAVFALAGAVASLSLPVGLFPRVNFPRVVIHLEAGDRPASRMAIEVTWPVEEAVRSVPEVRRVRSTTSRGSADISIDFAWGTDMVAALLQVESAINQVMRLLPAETRYTARRMDPTVFPVIGYSLVSDTHSLVELRDIGLYQIRPVLSTVPGVARIGVQGGATAEYHVIVDTAKLASFGLGLDDVAKAVSATNVLSAVGRLQEYDKLYLVLSDTQFRDLEQIGQTVLRSGENGQVQLEDVATVVSGVVPSWITVTADGHDAVLLQVFQQLGGDTVRIRREIAVKLVDVEKRLPSGVRIATWYDQSELIVSSAGSVRDAVLVGVLLAAVVLFVFLRNIRVTLIAAVAVPAVLAATILLLAVLKMSFNIMTLGGMAAAVGLIIDDGIVMTEHIMRRFREGTTDFRGRVLSAAREFTPPLAGSSTSTIIIFAPLAFLTGVTGAFFKALSLTMAAALTISFLVSWLAVPVLALLWLREKDAAEKGSGAFRERIHGAYRRSLRWILSRPRQILWVVVPLLAAGWVAYRHTGSGFMPTMDEGGFVLDYVAPAGTSLSETDRRLRQVEEILRATPEVMTYSRRTGTQLGGGVTEVNEGDFFVRLKPLPRRPIEEVMDDVRKRVEHFVPGLEIELAQLMEDLIGDLTAVPQPIEIKLFSDDDRLLQELPPRVAEAIRKVPGVVDVKSGVVLAGDAMDVVVSREKAALEGLASEDVTQLLLDHLTGVVTTQVQRGPKMVGVRVWIPEKDRDTRRVIETMLLRAPDGHLFPLKRVAELTAVTGQPQITREDLKRMVAVTGRITGRDMGSTLRDVKTVLRQPGLLPKDLYFTLGGLYAEQQAAFRGLVKVIAAAVLLVFVLLLFLYESIRVAVSMMATTLLAMAAVFIGLWVTGTELNITALMGMTMIVGIVTEVSIFYYSEYSELSGERDLVERMILAGQNRMRPIAMTTFAAILALSPLALGIGRGAAMQQPLAIAIISGLFVQLPLVLLVLPALLRIVGRPVAAIPQ